MKGPMKKLVELLFQYIEARIDYEFASREEGADGHRVSAVKERLEVEKYQKSIEELVDD